MRTLAVAAALAAAVAAAPAAAQDSKKAKELAETYAGTLKVTPQVELTIVLNVEKGEGGALTATMDSPDQGARGIPVDTITLDGDTLTFEVKKIAGKFTGKRSKDGKEFAGEWSQGQGKLPLTLAEADAKELAGPVAPMELKGLWEGTLDAGGAKLRLVLRVEEVEGKDGLVPVLDSPDQGVDSIPVTSISLAGGEVKFENKSIGGSFRGRLDAMKGEIEGTWTQGGQRFPLTLKKTEKISEVRRPQHPKAPFPYRVEEVTYRNEPAGITLAGTLTLPEGDGPFPVVLLITGSGPQDRDETIFAHKPFLVLADSLTRRGVAVLRVDDRGVGGSGGSMATSTSEDFAGDALAGVAFLKSRKEVNPGSIGLVGHSEGGLIAPMVAARSDDVAFIVLLAGTGLTGEDILLRQSELILKAEKASERVVAAQLETLRKIIGVIKAEKDEKAADEKLTAVLKELAEDASEVLPVEFKKALEAGGGLAARVKPMNSPWFRYFLSYDPRTSLQKVKCPVLAINGEKDLQVPARANLAEIEKALKAGGNTRVTIAELPGLNHLFQHSESGSPTEYGSIEETFAPEALDLIGEWIARQTSGG